MKGQSTRSAILTFERLRETINLGSPVVVCSITHQRFIRGENAVIVVIGPNPIWGALRDDIKNLSDDDFLGECFPMRIIVETAGQRLNLDGVEAF